MGTTVGSPPAGVGEAVIERGKSIELDLVDPHPDNASVHTEADIAYLVASLRRFGQPRDLIVRRRGKRYQLIAGHGVRLALLRLSVTHVFCTIVPDHWTDVQAAGYLLIDNHRADQDDQRLLLLWDRQIEAGEELATVGITADEVEAVRAMLDMDAPGVEVRAPARPRAVSDQQQHQHIKLVLYMQQVDLVENAIKKTGLDNRGAALALICQAFLENDWLPPEEGARTFLD
jgi:ParB-like chromosome segregation protein Spo0J